MSREDKALFALDKSGVGLEIGPSHNPIAPKSKGFNVRILDHTDADGLRAKYQPHGINLDKVEEVDFVWSGEPLPQLIGQAECFDWIIASHVIEHVPDLISFLRECKALLKADGVLSLVIPDKRYCFDYFSASSSTGQLLDAFAERRVRPSGGQVFDHLANAAKRGGSIAWGPGNERGDIDLVHTLADAKSIWKHSQTSSDYIDVHCWRFTPLSFDLLLSDLRHLDLVHFEITAEFETSGCEFYRSLRKSARELPPGDRLLSLKKRKEEDA